VAVEPGEPGEPGDPGDPDEEPEAFDDLEPTLMICLAMRAPTTAPPHARTARIRPIKIPITSY
jgi:hypothetical protein